MRTRELLVALLVAGSSPGFAADDVLTLLSGTWAGPGLLIQFDAERLLAKTDPDRPFSWEPLLIENVAGHMVVFRIGQRSYIGLFDQDRLTVTSPEFSGSFSLTRRN